MPGLGGCGFIYRWSCTPRVGPWRVACNHGAQGVLFATWRSYPPRGPSPNLPWFSCVYLFLTRFSGAILEVFWCSKRVMQHIAEKISTSTFQRYKFCTNQSSNGRVMAPGSWGAGAIFLCFSGEDSGQTGEATDEPRVACRS